MHMVGCTSLKNMEEDRVKFRGGLLYRATCVTNVLPKSPAVDAALVRRRGLSATRMLDKASGYESPVR